MTCDDRELQLNALIDGELDRAAAQDLLQHVADCPDCAATLVGLMAVKTRLAALAPERVAPAIVVQRVDQALLVHARRFNLLRWTAGFGLGTLASGLAAVIAFIFLPNNELPTLRAIVDANNRVAMANMVPYNGEPIRAQADAWFIEHKLAAPAALNLTSYGFALKAYRADYVAGHRAAVLDYSSSGKNVSLIAWPAGGEPALGLRYGDVSGQQVQYWNDGKLEYWASGSDTATLLRFVAAYRVRP